MNLSNKDKVMDISVNLARVSDWRMQEDLQRMRRIDQFLEEIKEYLATMDEVDFSVRFQPTLKKFKEEIGRASCRERV